MLGFFWMPPLQESCETFNPVVSLSHSLSSALYLFFYLIFCVPAERDSGALRLLPWAVSLGRGDNTMARVGRTRADSSTVKRGMGTLNSHKFKVNTGNKVNYYPFFFVSSPIPICVISIYYFIPLYNWRLWGCRDNLQRG